jgi:glycosyltransferase involved in cell wall biosynthesis
MSNKSKSRLLFIYPNQFGYHTDTFKYCEHLQDRYEITYICFDQGFEKLGNTEVNVIYCNYNIGKIKRLILFFKRAISISHKIDFEVIFTVQFKYSFIIGLFARSNLKILDFRTGDLSLNRFKRKVKNLFLRFDSLFFDKVSVISEGLREILNLSAKNTLILPLGADVMSLREHNYGRFDLLYVGVLKIRNIHQTIEGIGLFLNSYPDFRSKVSYTIIGFGQNTDIAKILRTIDEWGLNGIVEYLGRKKITDLHLYFDRCNIGVSYIPIVPYYEHQPATKTFEYILSGLFTIATDTYENRQVINESNGILCKDTPEAFAESLDKLFHMRNEIEERKVRDSLLDYRWKEIVNNKLLPFLLNN